MKKVEFNVTCIAYYPAEIKVEDNLTKTEILDQIHDQLPNIPCKHLSWVNDLDPEDAVTMEDILSIKQITENN